MELTGKQHLPVPRDRVWAALLDPATLKAAIPGCESITDQGNGVYAIGMLAAVGPVKARFKGRLQQQDVQAPQRYTLSFEGDGGIVGFAKGSAEVELQEEGQARDQTLLAYRAQAQIGGRLAQIGSRLVDATAAKMSSQFFERLTLVIRSGIPAEAVVSPPPDESVEVPTAVVSVTSASASTQPSAAATAAAPSPSAMSGAVTITMPAWAWAFTVAVVALVAAWLATV